ncbi:MAG TPA: hypothetical protein VF033_14965 [Steroidobacteraceae bacterium]|jgi:predicted nucleotidyltransferase
MESSRKAELAGFDLTLVEVELFGSRVRVIGLEDLIAAKEALGREKDLLAAKELRAILERGRMAAI